MLGFGGSRGWGSVEVEGGVSCGGTEDGVGDREWSVVCEQRMERGRHQGKVHVGDVEEAEVLLLLHTNNCYRCYDNTIQILVKALER